MIPWADADAYLVLKTTKGVCDMKFTTGWVQEATLDKGMCAAVHAIGLHNHLNANCRTIREEMNDESDEFLDLFGGEEIVYIKGARTSTGFFTIEKPPHVTRLYRASVNGTAVEMEPVPVAVESLDPRFCFVLDAGETLWIWSGWKARIMVANTRLFVERVNKMDGKGAAVIEACRKPKVSEEFWTAFWGQPTRPDEPIEEHVPENFVPERKRRYQVNIGMGFLELAQVDLSKGFAIQTDSSAPTATCATSSVARVSHGDHSELSMYMQSEHNQPCALVGGGNLEESAPLSGIFTISKETDIFD